MMAAAARSGGRCSISRCGSDAADAQQRGEVGFSQVRGLATRATRPAARRLPQKSDAGLGDHLDTATEPFPDCRTPDLLGRAVPRPEPECAGKRKSSRLRRGAPWLKTMLVQCAWAAKRAKNSYYSAQFHRLRSRRGPQKAICAVAASLLTAIYHMLKSGLPHRDLGADYFDRRSPEAKAKRLLAQLAKLGFAAQLQPLAA